MLTLISIETDQRFEFPDEADQLTIGRVEGNDVVVDNPLISALHGQITLRQGVYRFQDLNSTNGSAVVRGDQKTRLDGETREEFELEEGDRILLGDEEEPAVLVVEVCRAPEERTEETEVSASHRMKSIRELGQKIESDGGSLVPFLTLSERLASASTGKEAEIEFHDCVREVIPSIRDITLVDAPEAGSVLQQITVLKIAGAQGEVARVPVDLDEGIGRVALLKSGTTGFSPADLDACALAATLLSIRLRQLQTGDGGLV